VTFNEGSVGEFDVLPYLKYEAFENLKDLNEFKKVFNGKFYIEWDCGADLSADSIKANIKFKK
jgi:hypothetical protein